jgi:hypothetical protein
VNCAVWDLSHPRVSNLGISEVNQGNVFQAFLAGNRNYFRRKNMIAEGAEPSEVMV